MTDNSVVPLRPLNKANLNRAKQRLTDVVAEIFCDRPRIDLCLAIGSGHRALERGTPFFSAIEVAEGVMKVWENMIDTINASLIEQRNHERLKAYRTKRAALEL